MAQNRKKDNGFKILVVLFVYIAFSCLTSTASAGAPPYNNRPGYLLPNLYSPYINQSAGDCFTETDSFKAFNHPFRPPPFFPNMSVNHAFMNISCESSGDRYISEVWYFTDWNEFRTQREALLKYLTQHGTIFNVTLDLSEELARTNNSYVAGLQTRQINAIRYEDSTTSGYFVIFSSVLFPGPNYYITYYGVVAPTDFKNHSTQLDALMMATFPGLIEYQTQSNPEFPMASQPTPFPAGVILIAFGIVAFIRALQGRS